MSSTGRQWFRVTENLALVVSVVALVVAVGGTAVSCQAADSAKAEARLAQEAYDKEMSEQARRVNLNDDNLRSWLTLENTSSLPIRDIRVYLSESGEPVAQYASRRELAGCRFLRLKVGGTDPADLVVVFTDAFEEQWITDSAGGLKQSDLGPLELPADRRYWKFRVRNVTPCQ